MQREYWLNKWEQGDIAFHEENGNELLKTFFGKLTLPSKPRVLVPLCGKTRDIHWLLDQGCIVIGVEISELAVNQLFEELGKTVEVSQQNSVKRYQSGNLTVFVGDIFACTAAHFGKIDLIYDRAALVALPHDTRVRYAMHLAKQSYQAHQLLVTFEYDQKLMQGPPFSISESALISYYGNWYQSNLMLRARIDEKLKGLKEAYCELWHLRAI